MDGVAQARQSRWWIPAAAAAAVLAVTAPMVFGSGNVAATAVWAVAVAMYAIAISDIAQSGATPAGPASGRLGRDALVVGVCGVLSGLAAAAIWAWVSSRVDGCPPEEPVGICGGEKLILGFLWPLPIVIVAVALAALRVSRGLLAGLAAVPVAALIVMLYNKQLPGTPVPAPWLLAGLTVAGFLLAWAGGAKAIPPWLRLAVITVLLALGPLASRLQG